MLRNIGDIKSFINQCQADLEANEIIINLKKQGVISCSNPIEVRSIKTNELIYKGEEDLI